MACIEHYVKDAENIFQEIKFRHKQAQDNVYLENKAATTIQRHFRGYVTRKHIKYLHKCATTIQRHWRGMVGRRVYSQLLKEAVHKMYLEHYNHMATTIQRVWRGHYVRKNVFSFYKLREYVNNILAKNKEFSEYAKEYQAQRKDLEEMERQQECQEWLTYMSFRLHHLIRTRQIEGIYSTRGTFQYSAIEQLLKDVKFLDYMDMKHAEKLSLKKSKQNYIFEGRMRECEEAWHQRNDPGKYSLATGEYGMDEKEATLQQKAREKLLQIQDKPMRFGIVRPDKASMLLSVKEYKCPQFHRVPRQVQQ